MPIDMLMPQLSPTMTEGRLAKWLKKEGDVIRAGDVVAEVETDKATMEVESSSDGIIHKIIGAVGVDVLVGTPIAVLKKKDETVPADYVPVSKASDKASEDKAKVPASAGTAPVVAPAVAAPVMAAAVLPTFSAAPMSVGYAEQVGRVKASPLARKLAKDKGVSLSSVAGSGPYGRVVAEDVLKAQTGIRQIVRHPDAVEKLTPMRKAIANRLTASKQTVPHFYLNARVRMDTLMDLRAQLNGYLEAQKVKLSVNDFIVKACGLALRDFPKANAAWNGDSVVVFGNVDVSVAVSIDGGLITPIVANADQKSVVQISGEVKQLAADARAGKLKPEQYEGGSFSLSNLGMYGVDQFAAIINPPQAAILACGAAVEQPVVIDGMVDVGHVMDITLSVDHRVIDGALGAELLGAIKGYLEAPAVMLLG